MNLCAVYLIEYWSQLGAVRRDIAVMQAEISTMLETTPMVGRAWPYIEAGA